MIDNKKFEKICRYSAKNLKKYLKGKLETIYGEENVTNGNGFLFARGTFPVLLLAHMDTVHPHVPAKIVYSTTEAGRVKVSSPDGIGGDDRCGVYMILDVIKHKKCSVLFCEDEEIGCIGASKFVLTDLCKKLCEEEAFKYLIEFDRANSNDAVFYDCENDEFIDFCQSTGFYKEAWGTCSDISEVAPALKTAAVNLSCGYYNQHQKKEYVILSEMERSIEEAKKLLDATDLTKHFEYIERQFFYGGYNWNKKGYITSGKNNYTGNERSWTTESSGLWNSDTFESDGQLYKYRAEYDDYYTDEEYADLQRQGSGYDYALPINDVDEEDDSMKFFYVEFKTPHLKYSTTFASYICRNKYEAIGLFMEEHTDMCYNDIEEITYDKTGWEM